MTQVSNILEKPTFGKSTLADTEKLQVAPNDSTLVNTKGSSPETPEPTGK